MSPARVIVHPQRTPLRGNVPVVADADVTERALLLAALADGTSTLEAAHASAGAERACTALRLLGVSIETELGRLRVDGRGMHGLSAPSEPLDVTGLPILLDGLLGCLSAMPFESSVVPLQPGPHADVRLSLLGARGAAIKAAPDAWQLGGLRERPTPLELVLPPGDSGLKHMLLVSGLFASGLTAVTEVLATPDHTERMLEALRLPVRSTGPGVTLHPPRDADAMKSFNLEVPGDPTAAAALLSLAAVIPGSLVAARDVSMNPSRDVLSHSFAAFSVALSVMPGAASLGEPRAELSVAAGAAPRSGKLGGEIGMRLREELYPLVVLAVKAAGRSLICDLSPGHDASSVAKLVGFLRSFGIGAEPIEQGLLIEGQPGAPLKATRLTTGGDPRLALLGVLLGLLADGPSEIDDVDCISEFYPRFFGTLRALGATLEVSR